MTAQAHVELLDHRIAVLQAQVAEKAAQAPSGPASQQEPAASGPDSSPSLLAAGVASTAVVSSHLAGVRPFSARYRVIHCLLSLMC